MAYLNPEGDTLPNVGGENAHLDAKAATEMIERSSSGNYMKWDAPGVTVIPEGEDKIIQDVAAQFNRFQQKNFDEHHHAFRGTHLKTQGCVAGKLIVHDKLPDHLKQGMFSKGGEYDTIFRYSSLTPKLLPDTAAAPRGCAFKVFGVKGDKIFQSPDQETQDWTFNNYSTLELRTPKATNEIADSLERNWNNNDEFVKEIVARPDADVATRGAKLPNEHMCYMTQHTQSAYRFGDYVAKLALIPRTEEQKKLKEWRVKDDDQPNVLSQATREFHQKNTVEYTLVAQLLQNIDEQSVEDIGIDWDPEKYPFEEIGYLSFPPQDSWDGKFRNYWEEITCNTWHGLKEHEPLGSTNRMRKVVYAESRKLRMRINGTTCVEPKSLSEVPLPQAITA